MPVVAMEGLARDRGGQCGDRVGAVVSAVDTRPAVGGQQVGMPRVFRTVLLACFHAANVSSVRPLRTS